MARSATEDALARELEQRDRRNAIVRAFHAQTRGLSDASAILEALSGIFLERLGIRHFLYGDTIDGDPSQLEVFHTVDGTHYHHGRENNPFLVPFRSLIDTYEWDEARVVNDNVEEHRESSDPVQAAADQLGVRSGILVPIRKDGVLVGVMAVLHDAPRYWTRDEIELCEDLAERIWSTVSRARVERELLERQRAQAFIIDWSDRVRRLMSAGEILATTLESLGAYLQVSRATYSQSDSTGRLFTVEGEWRDGVMPLAGSSFSLDHVGQVVDREWTAGEIVCYHDILGDPRMEPEATEGYVATEILAFVSVPLMLDGRVQCALSVQHREARRWRDSELSVLGEIAERLWVTLGRARAMAELQERERHQAFLLSWTDRLRTETSPGVILTTTLEWLGRHLGISRVTYARAAQDGLSFTTTEEWCDGVSSQLGRRFTPSNFGSGGKEGWTSGTAVRHDAIAPEVADRYASAQIGAFVSAPAVHDGAVKSILSAQHHSARRWDQGEVELIQDVAQRLWVTMERARVQAALLDRERHQAFLLDWSDQLRGQTDPLIIIDATLLRVLQHLGVTRANFAEMNAAGRFEVVREWRAGAGSAESVRREGIADGVHHDYVSGKIVGVDNIDADPRFDDEMRDAYSFVDATAFLGIPLVRGGRVGGVLSVQQSQPRRWYRAEVQLVRDLADRMWVLLERASAAAELQARERIQTFLIDWNDDIQGENDPRIILSRTLSRLGSHLGVSRANYAEAIDGGETLLVFEEWRADAPSVAGQRYPLAVLGGKLEAAHRAGQPIRVNDIADDPLFDGTNRPLFESIGIGAVMTLPMMRQGEIVAVLSVQHRQAHAWTDAELSLVREVAERTLAVLERVQSEARLAESEAQLAAFLENAPLIMHLKDAEGRYIRVNPEFARAMQRPPEDLIDRLPHEIFPGAIADKIAEVETRALAGEVASAELEMLLGDTYRSVLSIVFPIPGATGRARTAGFAIDLTDRKQTETALAKSREKLYQTEKLSALGSLLAGVSHELNNPLSIVVAQAVMMERQAQGTELAERAQKIRKAADRCARIVQVFLAMARQKQPERASIDLNAVVLAAHELADYGLRTDGIVTERLLGERLPRISADADQLHQIILNLLVNAQHAIVESGARDRRITLRTMAGETQGNLVLEVSDTGPGISEDIRRRIFEPFFTTKPQGHGTGVGLSFSKGLAEAHGGELELMPSGVGACFRLTLPVDPQGAAPIEHKAAEGPEASAPRRALVIDDEEEIADALSDFLSIEGFDCDIAVGGAAAKERLTHTPYDLVVSDLRMPDIDGPQLYAWVVRERPELVGRMAFATGDTLGLQAERFLGEVQKPVLEKPFTPEAVKRFLKQMDLA